MKRSRFILGVFVVAIAILVPKEIASSREPTNYVTPTNKGVTKRSGDYNTVDDYPSYLLQAYYDAHPEQYDSNAAYNTPQGEYTGRWS